MRKFLLLLFSTFILLPFGTYAQCNISAPNVTICSTQGAFPIQATASQFTTYLWSTSGTGTFTTTTNLGTVYTPSSADNAAGSVTLSLIGSGGSCTSQTATALITINPLPVVDAGFDQTSCGNVTLNAIVSGSSTFNWTSSGSGSFVSPTSPSSVYVPSQADITNESITLTATAISPGACLATDNIIISFLPVGVSAGFDLTTCLSTPVNLSGTVTNASNFTWSTSGTGTFSSFTQINPIYQPSAADITAGIVTLTLTATGSSGCVSLDNLILTIINSGASVNAGPDQSMCDNSAQLNATFSGSGGVVWSTSGTGSFSSTSIANPLYFPSQADRTAGSVILTASTTNNGSCPVSSDQLTILINARAVLFASGNITACPNEPVFPTASVNVGTVTWTSSGTGTFSSSTSLTPIYTPSIADNTSGNYVLTVTSSSNGSCPSESRNVSVTLSGKTAAVSAGPDLTICGNVIQLNGTVTNATGGVWTTAGTGVFNPGSHYLSTSYVLSASDLAKSNLSFNLTTTGTCGAAVTDALTVSIVSSNTPTVNAGSDQVVTSASTTLSGIITGATGGIWSTSGSGVFSNVTSLTTTYTPSTLDIATGLIKIRLTSTGSGLCSTVTDELYLTVGTDLSITGTVKAAASALDRGVVFLFKQENAGLRFIKSDTIVVADAGLYSFDHIPTGTYVVLGSPILNSTFLSSSLPTYSGGTQNWTTAQSFSVTSNLTYDIALSPYVSANVNWNIGLDIIAGQIYANPNVSATARIAASDVPAPYVTVYLKDVSGNTVAYTQTDINGRYAFKNVQAGRYFAAPDFMGTILKNATAIPVLADGLASTVEDASMTLLEKTSTPTGILNTTKTEIIAYPNPAKNSISINIITSAGTGVIKLFNETGVLKLQQQVDLNETTVTLNIESLSAGVYTLQLVAENEIYTSKVIKY